MVNLSLEDYWKKNIRAARAVTWHFRFHPEAQRAVFPFFFCVHRAIVSGESRTIDSFPLPDRDLVHINMNKRWLTRLMRTRRTRRRVCVWEVVVNFFFLPESGRVLESAQREQLVLGETSCRERSHVCPFSLSLFIHSLLRYRAAWEARELELEKEKRRHTLWEKRRTPSKSKPVSF